MPWLGFRRGRESLFVCFCGDSGGIRCGGWGWLGGWGGDSVDSGIFGDSGDMNRI